MFNIPETLKFECELINQGVIPKPRMAILVNSYKCNQNCYFCFHRPYNDGTLMSTERTMQLIDELSSFGVKSMDYCGGGEVLCAPDMDKVFDHAAARGMKQCLITNGVLLKGAVMESAVNTMTFIRISLDTVNPELYKKLHGVDDCQVVLDNIKAALAYKKKIDSQCEISIKIALTEHTTLESVQEVFSYFKDSALTSIQIKHLWDKDGNYMNKSIDKESLGRLNNHGNMVVRKTKYPKYMKEQCWISPVQTTIDAKGNVYICCYYQNRDESHKIGNINEDSFKNIWYSPLHKSRIKDIKTNECLKHDCRFQKYMMVYRKNDKLGTWEFV